MKVIRLLHFEFPTKWGGQKVCLMHGALFFISRQYLMGAVMKYNYHLLFLRGTVGLACLNTSIFHWKNRQIRLKVESLGCHGNGYAD